VNHCLALDQVAAQAEEAQRQLLDTPIAEGVIEQPSRLGSAQQRERRNREVPRRVGDTKAAFKGLANFLWPKAHRGRRRNKRAEAHARDPVEAQPSRRQLLERTEMGQRARPAARQHDARRAAGKSSSRRLQRRALTCVGGDHLHLARLQSRDHLAAHRRAEDDELTTSQRGRLVQPCPVGLAGAHGQDEVGLVYAHTSPLLAWRESASEDDAVGIALGLIDRGKLATAQARHRAVAAERICQTFSHLCDRRPGVQPDYGDRSGRHGDGDRRAAGRQLGTHRARETKREARRILNQRLKPGTTELE
jgi:hypothetical protein